MKTTKSVRVGSLVGQGLNDGVVKEVRGTKAKVSWSCSGIGYGGTEWVLIASLTVDRY